MSLNRCLVKAGTLIALALLAVMASSAFGLQSRLASGGEFRGPSPCPGVGYDDGSSEDAIFFGGGNAGDPDFMMGVRFELDDFGFQPGLVELSGFCVGNSLAFAGGPWPNEVFIFPDVDGLPNLSLIREQATILTGDGTGAVQIVFDEPLFVNGDFWIMVRGDPMHSGEDFNLEIDLSSEPTGNSYLTDFGLVLLHQTGGNWSIRANLQALAPPRPVPAVGVAGLFLFLLALSFLGWKRLNSESN